MQVLESRIESTCRDIAHAAGWVTRKMNGLGFNSWPDRLFIPPKLRRKVYKGNTFHLYQRVFWVEFKRPGEEPTPAQDRMIKELRGRGEVVYVIDNVEEFRRVFQQHN